MAVVKNDDLDIMIEVEELLHKKLEETNGIKDEFDGKDYYYFDENDKEYEIWCKYWNLVEQLIGDKKEVSKKNADYNKRHAEYHRLSNNLYNARKRKDNKKIEYYTQKLKELKK